MNQLVVEHAIHTQLLEHRNFTCADAREVLNRVLALSQLARERPLDTTTAQCLVQMLAILSCEMEAQQVAHELGVQPVKTTSPTVVCNDHDAKSIDLSLHNSMYPPVVFSSSLGAPPFQEPWFEDDFLLSVLPTTNLRVPHDRIRGWLLLVIFLSATDFFCPDDTVGVVDNSCRLVACRTSRALHFTKSRLSSSGGVSVVVCTADNPQRRLFRRAWVVPRGKSLYIRRKMLVWHASVA